MTASLQLSSDPYDDALQAELGQHLALCLPSLASNAGMASSAPAAPFGAAAAGADAAAGTVPPAPPLRVLAQAPPSQPRTAVRRVPGSAGAMSRKKANAFFSPSRPREVDPADGDAAVAAGKAPLSAGANPGMTAAAPPGVPTADTSAGGATGPVAAVLRHQQQRSEPKEEDAAPAADAAAPPPPAPDAEAAPSPAAPLLGASSPAALPLEPPSHNLDQVCAAACRAALGCSDSHTCSVHGCVQEACLPAHLIAALADG